MSRVEARKEATCPMCDGTLLEPRSGDMWQCADCARQIHPYRVDSDEANA